ncbi:MAG: hypothetical protein GY790_17355 [Bacteroidetes bacterium]|nr:hypothetical protein [Bacteroidota bacterium]
MLIRTLARFTLILILICGNVELPGQGHAGVQPGETLTFDLSSTGITIKNIYSDINVWDFRQNWGQKASDQPAGYFRENFPFINTIQIMTATGGNANRDLFKNPGDRSVLDDYHFDELIAALANVVRQGLKPMIKTGAVPLKYSANPLIANFGVNVCPPDDYNVYYDYLKALADRVVAEFGLEEVKSWSWGVLTEYENKSWWSVDENPELSKKAYFKLYDYTVAALEDAIGADNLEVGAHAMVCHPGLWDEGDFIDHVAKGTNYVTGNTGTQIDFIAASFYDNKPGEAHPDNLLLSTTMNRIRERAEANDLTDLQYGIDEGRILFGPDGRDLDQRIVAHSFQGVSDARAFKLMNELDADWYSTWGLTTQGFWGGVPTVGTHVAGFSHKMVGEQQVQQLSEFKSGDSSNEVDALVTYNSKENKVHVMVYNYNCSLDAISKENPTIKIRNIAALKGSKVFVKRWTVDDSHGNYWPAWFSDMQTREISNEDFKRWDRYSIMAPLSLIDKADRDFWYANEERYRELAVLEVNETKNKIKNNTLLLPVELDHHGVVFFEIENVRIK